LKAHSRRSLRRETVWPFLLAGTITLCSGLPAATPAITSISTDKLGHFIAYGTLATAIVRHPAWLSRWIGWRWFVPLVLASAYGLGDEFRQSLTAGIRQYDLADWVADTAGALVAVSLYLAWPRYRQLLERPLGRKRLNARVEISPEELPNRVP
jgi:VanZ family protein